MLRGIRAGAVVLVTVTVVAAPPAIALGWWRHSGWRLPGRTTIDAWADDPLTGSTLVAVLGLALAGLWLLITFAALTTASRQLRQAWAQVRRMPIPTAGQATATSMAGAAVFGVPAAGLTSTASDVVPGMPDQPTTSASHTPTDSAGAGAADNDALQSGVALTDGSWLPPQTAQMITMAVGIGWLRRRRDYQPARPGPQPDVADLPGTVAAIQHTMAAASGTLPGPGAEAANSSVNPALSLDIAEHPTGLVGPGAEAAARGVFITALMSTPAVPVLITTSVAERLLGPGITALQQLPGVHIVDDVDAALALLETRLARQRVVVLADTPNADLVSNVQSTLLTSNATAVLLGAWPIGSTVHVNADGTTGAGRRWCVLSVQTAADLCILAAHFHGLTPIQHAATPTVLPKPSRAPAPRRSAAAAPPLRLAVLGRPALTWRGTPIHLRRSAALQTLVLLAVQPEGVSTLELGEALWPAERPHATSNRVYTTISELRRTIQTHTGAAAIDRDGDRYRLNTAAVDVDLWHLDTALTALTTAFDDEREHGDHLAKLYTGELAAGQSWPWLHVPRERLRRRMIDALMRLADRAEAHQAPEILHRAAVIDDCNEGVQRRLMAISASAGDHQRVLQLASAYRHRLAEQGIATTEDFDTYASGLQNR